MELKQNEKRENTIYKSNELKRHSLQKRKEENIMFNFRIILCADGLEIIDYTLNTPYSTLTLEQMEEYIEMDKQNVIMDRIKRKQKREEEQKRKQEQNLFYRLAIFMNKHINLFNIWDKNLIISIIENHRNSSYA